MSIFLLKCEAQINEFTSLQPLIVQPLKDMFFKLDLKVQMYLIQSIGQFRDN